MPIGFLVPAFLAGLAALLVPLVLHLRHRERRKPRPFPSLMFLARLPIRTERQRRITDWPLLLLRALALALLVFAFARPFLRDTTLDSAGSTGLTVLLLDRSASMDAAGVGGRWADSARAVIDALPAGRRVAVVSFDADAQILQAPTGDHAAARAAVTTAPPAAGGTRYGAGLRAASQLLAHEPVPGEIVLVTDLQRSGLVATSAPSLPAGTAVRTVALVADSPDNSAVTAIDVEPVAASSGRRAVIAARFDRHGGEGMRTADAVLEVDGRELSRRQVLLPPDGVTRATFDTAALSLAESRVVVRLDADDLPVDDARYGVIPPETTTRITIVAPGDARPDELRYVEQALGIGRDPAFEVQRVTRLDRATIERSAALVLLDAAPPDGELGATLTGWVQAGGGLVVVPGERMASRRRELSLVAARLDGTTERERGALLGDAETSHPALAAFQGAAVDGFASVRVRRHPVVEAGGSASVLLRYDDGDPALVAGALGAGRTMLVAIPLDVRRGDFPLQPAFLPFLRGVVGWAAGAGAPELAITSGEPWSAPAAVRTPVVRGPDGDITRAVTNARLVTLRESGFHEVYDGRAGGVPHAVLAVNAPASEADLATMPADELLLGVGEIPPAEAMTTAEAQTAREARQSGWRWLLLALLAVMTIETFVASRGWRAVPVRPLPVPEGEGGSR